MLCYCANLNCVVLQCLLIKLYCCIDLIMISRPSCLTCCLHVKHAVTQAVWLLLYAGKDLTKTCCWTAMSNSDQSRCCTSCPVLPQKGRYVTSQDFTLLHCMSLHRHTEPLHLCVDPFYFDSFTNQSTKQLSNHNALFICHMSYAPQGGCGLL